MIVSLIFINLQPVINTTDIILISFIKTKPNLLPRIFYVGKIRFFIPQVPYTSTTVFATSKHPFALFMESKTSDVFGNSLVV